MRLSQTALLQDELMVYLSRSMFVLVVIARLSNEVITLQQRS